VLHLFYHLRRDVLADPSVDANAAAKDFATRVRAFGERDDGQAITFSVLGQKADIGVMALCPDLSALDAFSVELARSELGGALVPAASYLSLTELSPYTSTADDEAARLQREEDLQPGEDEFERRLAEFRERMATYAEHRLHPQLPDRKVVAFYPMSKRREPSDNWYRLDFATRKELMGGHARVGRRYRGEVVQLITGSTGLDDWEWAVTLFADDPKVVKDIVTEMRFDEVSARYAEFGPFVTGLRADPETLLAHLAVSST
jgi:chlorite dismutase